MNCCSMETSGTDKFFSKHAKRCAKQFRKKGLDKCQKMLVAGISRPGLQSKNILEIGCGVGGLHLSLLKQGARQAFGVEISKGMLEQARTLAGEMGLVDRVAYRLGDFVLMNGDGSMEADDSVPECEITVLDKVICCYEDWKTLVTKSLAKTTETYAVSYPRPVWYTRLFFSAATALARIFRWSFHPFYHDSESIQRFIQSHGFEKRYENQTIVWLVLVFQKQQGELFP
ncbi:MAG: methyltransferase domain-containing protein [Bacteroidota bacterium]